MKTADPTPHTAPARRAPCPVADVVHLRDLDAAGGTRFSATDCENAVVDAPGLRALEVVDAAELLTLDLSRCRPGLWVSVTGCPKLRLLRLPARGRGSVIHWDFGSERAPEAFIHGAVEHLDACGRGFAFSLPESRPGDAPWRDVLVCADTARAAHVRAEAIALIAEHGVHQRLQPESGHPVRSLYVRGAVGRIHIPSPSVLTHLCVEDADGLRTLSVEPPLQRLRLFRTPGLSRLHARGHSVQLKWGGDGRRGVHFDGHFDEALLEATTLRPESDATFGHLSCDSAAGLAHRLILERRKPVEQYTIGSGGADLRPVEVSLLRDAAADGDVDAVKWLRRWIPQVRRPQAYMALDALRGLIAHTAHPPGRVPPEGDPAAGAVAIIEPSLAASDLWQLRASLFARFRQKDARVPWDWNLKFDLAEEALQADFEVFTHCRGLRRTAPVEVCWRNSERPQDLRTLGRAAFESDRAPVRALARTLLLEALSVAAAGPERTRQRRRVPFNHPSLHPLCRGAVANADRALADTFVAYAGRHLPPADAVRYLAPLAEAGHAPSRAAALAIGQLPADSRLLRAPRRSDRNIRAEAMAVALSPATSQRLAADETTDTHRSGRPA